MIRSWQTQYFGPNYFKLGPLYKPSHKRDISEVDFILNASFKWLKGKRVLDLGCGYGRHAVELAKRGYEVTGIDSSKHFLKLANKKASAEKINVNFQEKDMRDIGRRNYFDLVASLFTSFGLFSKDEQNEEVIKAVSASLKRGGIFVLDIMNAPFTVKNISDTPHKERLFKEEKVKLIEDFEYDKDAKQLKGTKRVYNLQNDKLVTKADFYIRLFTLEEIKDLLHKYGMQVVETYGDLDTKTNFTSHSSRMVILARKI